MADGEREPTKSVLGRALRVLDTFDDEHHELRLSDIARRAGLPLSTVHRLVGELVAWGGLERSDDHYRIGLRLFELGTIAPSWEQRRNAALPFMQDLYEATHENVHLAVLDGLEIVYLLKLSGHEQMPAPTRTGGRHAAHCTSLGKALLAFSPESAQEAVIAAGLEPKTRLTIRDPAAFRKELAAVREHGLAFDRQESTPGLGCIGAPIFGPGGVPAAAISVSGPIRRMNSATLASQIRAAALGSSRALSDLGAAGRFRRRR
jgi:IclR family transcriptional regulator, acetate operon repressor